MNIKNRLGVTLTVLVITIIVMLILFGITFSTSTDLLKNSQRNKMKTMLYMVKSRAEILLDDYLFEYDNEDSTIRSNNLKAVNDATIGQKLGGEYITTAKINDVKSVGYAVGSTTVPDKDKMIYCAWNKTELEKQGIDTKNLAKEDTIIIQYNLVEDSVDVASKKGFSNEGVAIHSLKDF